MTERVIFYSVLIIEHKQFIRALGCDPTEKDSNKLVDCLSSLDPSALVGEIEKFNGVQPLGRT